MTQDELIKKIKDIEWDDFEVKEAATALPKNIWETVSAFANTSGGWIVLGVKQMGEKFSISGVQNGEKIESDFLNIIRSRQKLNQLIAVKLKKYRIGNKLILAFYIPSSPFKPIYFSSEYNTFIRTGSGDRRASDFEITAMLRDQAFGTKSEQIIEESSLKMLNLDSLESYLEHVKAFNPEFPYSRLPTEKFCEKTGISKKGKLTYGGLLMFGKRDPIQYHVNNFWIDMLEIPGKNMGEAEPRYTFRMPEQENIWEYYNVLIQRLRTHIDAPFSTGPNGFSPDDNSQLYALREGLINMLAHADYFTPMHSTIRIFTDRIEFQNPGRFPFNLKDLRSQNHSIPRNPILIKLFRYAKLSENAGYGIDKMLSWEKLTHKKVKFKSDFVLSTIIYYQVSKNFADKWDEPLNEPLNERLNEPLTHTAKELLKAIRNNPKATKEDFAKLIQKSRSTITRTIAKLIEHKLIMRTGSDKNGFWEIIQNRKS